MRVILTVVVLALSATGAVAETKFSASDVAGVGINKSGRVVISNDSRSITAYHFHGNVREALVKLRSERRLNYRPYGSVLYNSSSVVPRQLSPELSAVIADAAKKHGLDPRLITEVARRESAFDPHAVSRAGASGIMQLMPATARFLGVKDIFDVRQNVEGGTRYLRMLLDTFRGDLDLTLAAYNAGPGAVERYGGIPPYAETRAYVTSIKSGYESAIRGTI